MFRFIHRHGRLTLIAALVLALAQVVPAFAQDNPGIEPPAPPLEVVSSEPKPADTASEDTDAAKVDPKGQVLDGAPQLFLPLLNLPNGPVEGAATTAYWRDVLREGFEGAFPSGLWSLRDYNGSLGGTYVWNDVSNRHLGGYWSAHPKGGPPYANYMASQMTWGPFSLYGAQAAELRFSFFLVSESGYDFLRYGYSCTNGATWTDLSVSGNYVTWRNVTVPLTSCLGAPYVKVRFAFDSDTNTVYEGAYVDDIWIRKYQ
jgi:hypothetical protein